MTFNHDQNLGRHGCGAHRLAAELGTDFERRKKRLRSKANRSICLESGRRTHGTVSAIEKKQIQSIPRDSICLPPLLGAVIFRFSQIRLAVLRTGAGASVAAKYRNGKTARHLKLKCILYANAFAFFLPAPVPFHSFSLRLRELASDLTERMGWGECETENRAGEQGKNEIGD